MLFYDLVKTGNVANEHFRERRTPVRQENMDDEKFLSIS